MRITLREQTMTTYFVRALLWMTKNGFTLMMWKLKPGRRNEDPRKRFSYDSISRSCWLFTLITRELISIVFFLSWTIAWMYWKEMTWTLLFIRDFCTTVHPQPSYLPDLVSDDIFYSSNSSYFSRNDDLTLLGIWN